MNPSTLRRWLPAVLYSAVAATFVALTPVLRSIVGGNNPIFRHAGTWIAFVTSIWALCFAIDVGRRLPRRLLTVPAVLLAWWLGVETFASPYLAQPLGLVQIAAVHDPDHRPRNVGPGWNSDHLSGTLEPAAFLPQDFNIIFLGDSFTIGLGVKPEQSFPSVVEHKLSSWKPEVRFHVANFGWLSSSPLLSWRRLLDIGEHYKPRLVVMCVDMTDFQDDLRYECMIERRGIYRFYDRIPMTLRLFQVVAPDAYQRFVAATSGGAPPQRFFASEQPLEKSRPWCEALKGNLDRIADWCRAHGAAYVVVALPRAYQYDARESPRNWEADEYTVLGPYSLEPFRWFEELRARVPYPVFSVLEDFQTKRFFPTCFEADPHWTPTGHQVAARAITSDLEPIIERLLAH